MKLGGLGTGSGFTNIRLTMFLKPFPSFFRMQEYKERNGCHTHYRKNNQCIQHIINCSYYNINLFLPIRLKIQVLLNISTTCIPKIHQKMPSEQNLSRYTLKYPSGNPRTSPSSSSFANYTGTNVNKVLFSDKNIR